MAAKDDPEKLLQLITKAKSILVTTHEHIDHDAVCSCLILYKILTVYLKKENVDVIVQQDHWPQFVKMNLPGLPVIQNRALGTYIDTKAYDLVCLVDAQDMARCLATTEPDASQSQHTIIFDHHPLGNMLVAKMLFNGILTSAAEQLYLVFRSVIPKIKSDKSIAYLVEIGMLADTNRFLYQDVVTANTFNLFAELFRTNPISIEKVSEQLLKYTRQSVSVLTHIFNNLILKNTYGYSIVTRDFYDDGHYTQEDLQSAKTEFLQVYLRSVDGINWGFLVKPRIEKYRWDINFRSKAKTVDVGKIAFKLGGGGHYGASSAVVTAQTPEAVIRMVFNAMGRKR